MRPSTCMRNRSSARVWRRAWCGARLERTHARENAKWWRRLRLREARGRAHVGAEEGDAAVVGRDVEGGLRLEHAVLDAALAGQVCTRPVCARGAGLVAARARHRARRLAQREDGTQVAGGVVGQKRGELHLRGHHWRARSGQAGGWARRRWGRGSQPACQPPAWPLTRRRGCALAVHVAAFAAPTAPARAQPPRPRGGAGRGASLAALGGGGVQVAGAARGRAPAHPALGSGPKSWP